MHLEKRLSDEKEKLNIEKGELTLNQLCHYDDNVGREFPAPASSGGEDSRSVGGTEQFSSAPLFFGMITEISENDYSDEKID